jgi:hypothetical protein
MKFAILKNEFDDGHENWAKACNNFSVDFTIVDLIKEDWLNILMKGRFDALLACPSGRESLYKQLYDERIYTLEKELSYLVYPSFKEISIHENKRFLSYWLTSHSLPHPRTFIFYEKKEALDFTVNHALPVVGKFNIGASGKGVKIIREKEELVTYINSAFSSGLRQNWGPNLQMGGYGGRIIKLIKNPARIINRLKVYQKDFNEVQKGFVILQEYIPHEYEWRIVRIGKSYFGHKKVKQGDKASGTKGIDYDAPNDKLLSFVRDLCLKNNFNSMAVDLFEHGEGNYLINELQCIFGHVQDYICEKDGKPGRFIFENNQWHFETGNFNTNLSYNLRLENLLEIIKK